MKYGEMLIIDVKFVEIFLKGRELFFIDFVECVYWVYYVGNIVCFDSYFFWFLDVLWDCIIVLLFYIND